MFSVRFAREVIVTRHARQRMIERDVSDDLLLRLIDEGLTRYRDSTHLWAWLDVPGRDDNLVCRVGARRGAGGQDTYASLGVDVMKTTYYDQDDILVMRLSDKPIVREVSQDWNTHVSYAADGSVVETVVLEAHVSGAWPLQVEHASAA